MTRKKIKAAFFDAPMELDLREVDLPEMTSGTARIKVLYGGICGSDIHGFRGHSAFLEFPRIPGHEAIGEVVELEDSSGRVSVGDSVVVNPMVTCGICYPCRIGRRNCCVSMQVIGVHLDGTWCQEVVYPVEMLHRFPEKLPQEWGALCEPLSIGLQVNRRGTVTKDDRVMILGAGTIGLTALISAKLAGASVLVSDRFSLRLETALTLGADKTLNFAEESEADLVAEFTDGDGPSVVVDAVGTSETLAHAIELVCPAGRVVSLGITADPCSLPSNILVRKEIDLIGSRLNRDLFDEVIQALAKGEIDPKPLITHRYPLNEVLAAMSQACDRPDETGKVLLKM